MSNNRLEGKVVIVTGAATGVGAAIARLFMEQGASVMLADPNEERICDEAKTLNSLGGRVKAFRCSPTRKLDQNNLFAATMDQFGKLNCLVNAFMRVDICKATKMPVDVLEKNLHELLFSNIRLSQMAAQQFIAQQKAESSEEAGNIINVVLGNPTRLIPSRFALGVTNAALIQAMRGFAIDLAEQAIRVNAIAIGSVTSDVAKMNTEETREALLQHTPIARLGEADEIAGAALFLASSESRYLTGQVLCVDGGRNALDIYLPETVPQQV